MAINEVGRGASCQSGFYKNDPFYLYPSQNDIQDQILREGTKARFLEASEDVLGRGSAEARLASLWVVDLVEEGRKEVNIKRFLLCESAPSISHSKLLLSTLYLLGVLTTMSAFL